MTPYIKPQMVAHIAMADDETLVQMNAKLLERCDAMLRKDATTVTRIGKLEDRIVKLEDRAEYLEELTDFNCTYFVEPQIVADAAELLLFAIRKQPRKVVPFKHYSYANPLSISVAKQAVNMRIAPDVATFCAKANKCIDDRNKIVHASGVDTMEERITRSLDAFRTYHKQLDSRYIFERKLFEKFARLHRICFSAAPQGEPATRAPYPRVR